MSHAAREHGNVTVLSGSVSSFVLSLFSHANTQKKTSPFFFFASGFSESLWPLYSPMYSALSHFAPFPPSYSSSLCFRQASPCQSVVAMCRSGTSPRETVGLTTWRSASAGDAVCPGLMSPWRYARETSTHTHTEDIAF